MSENRQEYIWSKEWQEKINRSQEAFENGEYKTFHNVEDLLADLTGEECEKINRRRNRDGHNPQRN